MVRTGACTKNIFTAIGVIAVLAFCSAQSNDSDIKKLVQLQQDTNRVNVLLEVSKNYLYADSEKSQEYAVQALELSMKLHFDMGQARCYNLLGVLSDLHGLNGEAISYYLKAIPIFERLNYSNGIAKCYTNLGNLCSVEKNIPLAIKYYDKSLDIQRQRKDTLAIANVYTNLGAAHYRDKAYYNALRAYQQSQNLINTFSKPLNPEVIRIRLANLTNNAIVYKDLKNYDHAETNLQECLSIARSTNNLLLQSYIYVSLANICLDQDRPLVALEFGKAGMLIAKRMNHRRRISELYDVLTRTYEHTKDFKKAYAMRQLYIDLSDSLKDADNKSRIESELLRQSMSKKANDVKILESKHLASIFRKNILIITTVLSLIIVTLIFIRTRLHLKFKTQKELQLKNLQEQQLRLAKQLLLEKSELYEKLNAQLEKQNKSDEQKENEVTQFQTLLKSHLITLQDWDAFREIFEKVNPLFFDTIHYRYPEISISDLRLCACIKLRLSLAESATMLGMSVESIKQSRYRLKKKLNLQKEESLQEFINEI